MAQHRNSVHIALKAGDSQALQQCAVDKSYRVMVFCAGDDQGVQDVAFPHQSELKVNGDEIKANLRGLKGKPGTTRPVDITKALRLDKMTYVNNVEFTYALTIKVKPYSSRPWTSPVSYPSPNLPSGGAPRRLLALKRRVLFSGLFVLFYSSCTGYEY